MFSQLEYARRDFELVWRPDVRQQPQAALFTERMAGEDYALLMVMPPGEESSSLDYVPREVTYVIDTSGSMAGASIQQAKAALLLALQRLREGDFFNIVEFNTNTYTLYKQPVPATKATIRKASDYVQALRANGGTEMRSALETALAAPARTGKDSLRQVIFITDGSVGNEAELFKLIKDNIGTRRLFTVGIGSAPNSHFMQRAASFGRGTYTYIGTAAEVNEKMSALFSRIDNPLLTDIHIDWKSPSVAQWPEKVADLYLGEPIIVTAKLSAIGNNVVVSGNYAGKPWQRSVSTAIGDTSSGVNKVWARSQITSLMNKLYEGMAKDEIRHAVIDVALHHHLVSTYTSLVAVDITPTRHEGEHLSKTTVPVNLPEGWKHEAVFSGLPATATSANEYLLLGSLAVAMLVLILLYLFYGFRSHGGVD
jgi:Ca-activated chloride channel family protein